MKCRPRKLLKLGLFVLAGAIVNVAVAWGQWVIDSDDPITLFGYCYSRYQSGWPTTALQQPYTGFIPAVSGVEFDCFPRLPLWPGFAINTAFYAAILWLLFAAPFKVRRWRRIRGGLCPACAYPVGQSDMCTECGAALRRKR